MDHFHIRIRGSAVAIVGTLALVAPARAAVFSDTLVQPPRLAAPERGSVAGTLANLAFDPGSMSRGDFALPIPITLPTERGAPLVDLLPRYSPDAGLSEWGMGWRADLAIQRFAIVGDIDPGGDEFVSPWGRLRRGSDGKYRSLGKPSQIALARVNGGWVGLDAEGNSFVFAASDSVAAGHAWMLTRVDSVLGDATVLTYERNASGRPFVSAVEWGGRGSQRQYRLELSYDPLAVVLDDYRPGVRLSLDRRVREVRVATRSAASAAFETAWTYQLDYRQSPRGAAFYLAGVTRIYRSGQREPTHSYDYDLGDTTLATATLIDAPALDPLLASFGANTLQPHKALAFDLEEDGEADFEIAKDQTLVRIRGGAVSTEPLPTDPASNPLCRSPVSSSNQPRVLARLTADADEPQVIRTTANALTGKTRILVCDRLGVPLFDHEISGGWALGPNIHLVDLNHDHKPDLVRLFSRGFQVVENQSGPDGYNFVVRPQGTLTDAFTPEASWVHDMNGDGLPDLVSRFPSSVAVWHGLGQFRFAATARSLVARTADGSTVTDLNQRHLTFVDVNRDGLTDVLATRGRLLSLFINSGTQLTEVIVPGFISITSEFGAPVIADVTGTGNFAVLIVQGIRAKALPLMTPATGLMVATHDGKGTDVSFGYARSAASAGIGQRSIVLEELTVASSGYDPAASHYDYGAPILHTLGKHLVGFASVDRRSPELTEHVEFFHDDDLAGVRELTETTDERSPDVVKLTRELYDDVALQGVRWLRRAVVESGHRNAADTVELSTTTQYSYERGFCPTIVTTTSPSGQLVATTALASVAAVPDDAHCLARSQTLLGIHPDPAHDFNHFVDIARNDVGQITRITQIALPMAPLVLQDITYDLDHRVASFGAPGRGTTLATHDAFGRLETLTDPLGVVTRAEETDPLNDRLLSLATARPNADVTAFFRYDGRERLQASWDDVSGASAAQPLTAYTYRDATSATPARIDARSLADAVAGTARIEVAVLAADGKTLVAGTWLGDHGAFGTATITTRATRTQRSAFVGNVTAAALDALTSDGLRALGTTLATTVEAGFGYPVETTTTHQAGVVGTASSELLLGASELVTRTQQPGGFTAESATDAAGKLVRKTDENGFSHGYAYDALGRLIRVDTPDGTHTIAFDGFGRPARIARAGIGSITYAYHPTSGLLTRKQRLSTTGAVVDTTDTTYDPIGRPTQLAQSAPGNASTLAFDHDGSLGDTTVPGQLGRTTRMRGDGWERTELFDPLGRPYLQRTLIAGWRDVTSDRTFRADGSLAADTLTITDPAGAVRFTAAKETVLDVFGRVAALKIDGNVLYTLTYDDEGRVASADFASGEAFRFDYDPVTHRARGHQVDAPDASGSLHIDLDSRGHIVAETYTHGDGETRRDYTYDGRGELTRAATHSETIAYGYTASGVLDSVDNGAGARSGDPKRALFAGYTRDAAGRVTGKGAWTFDYGGNGQLVRARRTGRLIDFVYDDANRRLLKRVDGVPVRADVAGGVLTADHFIELITIADVVVGALDNGRFIALLTDARGTPFGGPDGTPGLASPYGVRTVHLPLAEVIDYASLGWDSDLDLVRMGVRDYDAALGQFLTPDPLYLENLDRCQSSPLQCSLYAYALGNPVSYVDRDGRQAAVIGTFTQAAIDRMRDFFTDNARHSMPSGGTSGNTDPGLRYSCIATLNHGIEKLYDRTMWDQTRWGVNGPPQVDKTQNLMIDNSRTLGSATVKYRWDAATASATARTSEWDTVMRLSKGDVGWSVYLVSVAGGFHSVTVTLDNRNAAHPVIYVSDQNSGSRGWQGFTAKANFEAFMKDWQDAAGAAYTAPDRYPRPLDPPPVQARYVRLKPDP
jgi:RHS repeat-associated protein